MWLEDFGRSCSSFDAIVPSGLPSVACFSTGPSPSQGHSKEESLQQHHSFLERNNRDQHGKGTVSEE